MGRLILLYDGQRVRVESGLLKQKSRFYRSIEGRVALITDYVDYDCVLIEFEREIPVWNEALQEYEKKNFAYVDAEVLRPIVDNSEDEYLPGICEDIL